MIDSTAIARTRALLQEPVLAGLLATLNPPGEETRVVGGAIRNALIGVPVHDVDLGTTMLPEAVSMHGKTAGWRAVPTGIEHGTVTLVRDGHAFEVTTLREDIETDGRRAKVRFGRDFAHDAARRDFTINALSMGVDGVLHDYFGGAADLAARRVCFIGDPDQRLREDYLRGLRFLRFSAAYGDGKLDEVGFAAVKRHRDGYPKLSRERVRQEFLKLMMAEAALPVIRDAEGILSEILGFRLDIETFAQAIGFARHEGIVLDAMARLAALAPEHSCDDAKIWQARLRLSNAEIGSLRRIGEAMNVGDVPPRLLHYHFGEETIPALVLRAATLIDPAGDLSERLREAKKPTPEFLLSGADIVAAGTAPGPRVGELLAQAERCWIEQGFPEARRAQEAILRAVLAQS